MEISSIEQYCLNKTDHNIYPECMEYWAYQKDGMNHKPKIISIVFLIILMVLCIAGNVLVLVAFIMYRRLRVITHYYIVSLAVSDLIVGLISMPIWLSFELTGFKELPDWIDDIQMTQVMEFIDILSCVSSIVNLAAISIDRFFGIVTPLKHKAWMTEKSAILFIISCWIYSAVIAGTKLAPQFEDYIIFNFTAGFALPLLIICSSYAFIFIQVRRHANRKISNQISKQWTLARTISVVVSLFLICWTPFFLIVLMYQYCLSCTFFEQPWFEYIPGIIKTLHYFNSCCNPFIYGVFNVNFRSAYKGILYKCLGKEMKPTPYDVSIIIGRNASLRNRSNTSVSIMSYMESQSGANQENDELLTTGDRIRTSSFSNIANALPKPLSPKRSLEDEPRMLLRQKFQKQLSLENYSPVQTPTSSFEDDTLLSETVSLSLSETDSLPYAESPSHTLFTENSPNTENSLNAEDSKWEINNLTNDALIDFDVLLDQAKESDI